MNLNECLAYAERGAYLLPADRDKQPLTRHGFYDASTDPRTLAAWAKRYPQANTAMRTGGPRCWLVVDVDRHAGGADGFATWDGFALGDLGEPWTTTPQGGQHHFFTAPAPIGSANGIIGPGVDHRGDNGMVLVPGSRTVHGVYTWQRSILAADPPPLPAVLWQRLNQAQTQPTSGANWQTFTTVAGAVNRLARAQVGERNSTLNLTAYLCGRLVAMGRADEATTFDLLKETALAIGLPLKETLRTLRSGFYDGLHARGCMPLEENRIAALAALQWALSSPWTGPGAGSNYRVYMSLATTWLRTGGDTFGVDVRTLAELANVGHSTAGRAIHRLVDAGLVERLTVGGNLLVQPTGGVVAASVFRLAKVSNSGTLNHATGYNPVQAQPEASESDPDRTNLGAPSGGAAVQPDSAGVVECPTIAHLCYAHDAFSWAGLGGRAAQVYGMLRASGPATVTEVSEQTGACRQTVYTALHRMAHLVDGATGEVFPPLVVKVGKRWQAQPCDLDALAVFLRVDGRQARRKAQHEHERETYTALCQLDTVKRELRTQQQAGRKAARMGEAERERFHRLYEASFEAHRQRRKHHHSFSERT